MNRRVWAVARWEFLRFAKARDLVVGGLFFALMFGGGTLFGEFAGSQINRERTVGIVGTLDALAGGDLEIGRYRFTSIEASAADTLLVNEEIDAALIERGPSEWELRARSSSGWHATLRAQFGAMVARQRLGELDVDPVTLAEATTPPTITTSIVENVDREDGRTDVKTAAITLGVMFMGLFVGFSFVFVAITAEKTQRTTESMLSALTPQEWIDGKILGLTGAVLANLLATVGGYLLWQLVGSLFFDRALSLPGGAHPLDLLGLIVFAILGFAFWFTLFAMVAATIDDPNSSSRSSLMFLPMLLMAGAFVGLDDSDALWMRIIALVPGTSPAAMPVRLLRGDPHVIEIVASASLLGAGAWAFRRAAGRIFGTSMLMTGKEPGLREVLRWLREA